MIPYYAKSVVQRSKAGASAAYVHSVTKTYTSLLSPCKMLVARREPQTQWE